MGVSRGAGTVFAGRSDALGELRSAVEDLALRRGRLIAVSGEPGAGKSRLLTEFERILESQDTKPCSVRLFEFEECASFHMWELAFHSLRRAGLPVEDPVQEPSPDTIADAVEALCETAPFIGLFDNVQWADSDSLTALRHICPRMAHEPILIAVTYRLDQVSRRDVLADVVSDFATAPSCVTISLEPLSAAECRTVIEGTGGKFSEAQIHFLCTRSEGNPFLLSELLREPALLNGDSSTGIPSAIAARLDTQIDRAGPAARTCIERASVVGVRVSISLLAHLMDRDWIATEALLRDPMLAGIIDRQDHSAITYEFRHAIYRAHIARRIGSAEMMELHKKIAGHIEGRLDRAEDEKAYLFHLSRACPLVDVDIVAAEARAIIDRAQERNLIGMVLDCADMVVSTLRTVEGRPDPDPLLAEFLHAKADALGELWAAEPQKQALFEAFDIYARLDMQDELARVALTWVPTQADPGSSTVRRMVTPNEDLITAARSLVEPGSVAEAWIESQSDPIDLKHLDRIRRVAREAGDQALEMQVLAHRILHCHGAGLWDESRIYERELLDLSVSARNDDALFEGMYWSIARDVSSGEIGRTQRRRFAALDRTSQGRKVAAAVDALPLVDAVLGAWDIAEAKATRILDTLQTSCDSDPVGLSCMTLAQIHLERGHTTLFQESLSRLRSLSDRPDARVAVLLAAEAKALGKRESAREAMSIVNAINRAASQAYWVNQFCTFVAADVAVAKANQRAAQSLLASGSFDLVKFRVPATQFWNPFHQEASLLDLCGETELACVRFEDAIAFCRSADYHPELARTCFDYAAVLARDRLRPGRRAALLALGERSACKCGMVPLVERFRDLGATGAVTPEAHSPSGLTDREIEVGYYVSHGHTNREIGEELNISVHTVNRHIQNMLGKTGMSNRTELAAYLISKGLV